MSVGAVVLYSVVDGLLSKDNYMSAIVVTVIQIGVTKVHFGVIADWCIMDRAVDILLPSRVISEAIYFIIYVLLRASLLFL